MKVLKITSRIFAILAAILVIVALLVAAGMAGSSGGFLDLSNVIAIAVLGIAFACSVVTAITSVVYKSKIKSVVKDDSVIGVIRNTEKKGREL